MASSLRHGFKAEAERISLAVRTELCLGIRDRLDCQVLAGHLEVPVVSLMGLAADGAKPDCIRRLASEAAGFSALTVCVGTRRMIVFNPRHSTGRKANSLAHEISHIILEHPPAPAIGSGGCRNWNQTFEDEADWLAGALLVPREGALAWLQAGCSLADGAKQFGVSLPLFQWRINQTGIARQLNARYRARRA